MSYYQKYLKYKNKYLELRKQELKGGSVLGSCTGTLDAIDETHILDESVKTHCFNDADVKMSIIEHPFANKVADAKQCVLINHRKESYYRFRYDPSKILSGLQKYNTPDYPYAEIMEEIHKIFVEYYFMFGFD